MWGRGPSLAKRDWEAAAAQGHGGGRREGVWKGVPTEERGRQKEAEKEPEEIEPRGRRT